MKPEVKKKKLNPHTHKKKIFGPHWSEESGVQHKGWDRMQSENGMFSENGNGIRKKKKTRGRRKRRTMNCYLSPSTACNLTFFL